LRSVRTVIPTFNRACGVLAAVDAVALQTVTDLEIVVVNDGSSDDTMERITALAVKDVRIRLLAAPHDGVARARPRINDDVRDTAGPAACRHEMPLHSQ
jgi:hypothetical protein